jgi:adenosylcobinamide-phosphate synthase
MILQPLVLVLALVVDRCIGDPRTPYHPVALVGRFIGWWGRPEQWPRNIQRIMGFLLWFLTVFLFAVPFYLFGRYAPWLLYLLVGPFLLKICFAWRSLEEHTDAVISSLRKDIYEARDQAGMLVSRETQDLNHEQVRSAAYESMTENLVDSIISPIFYFGIFGLTGAAVFRVANTMDAMLGYRDDRLQIGWWSARIDDILNYIPARISGLLLLAYFGVQGRFRPACHILIRDRKKRPGINGGIPMAVMAGGVGVKFEKPGVYTIGDGEKDLESTGKEIVRAVRVVTVAFSLIVIIALILWGTLTNMYGI